MSTFFYKSPYNQPTDEERIELMQDVLDIINNTALRFIYHAVFLQIKDFCTSLRIEEFGASGNNSSKGQKITNLLIITREIFNIYNLLRIIRSTCQNLLLIVIIFFMTLNWSGIVSEH